MAHAYTHTGPSFFVLRPHLLWRIAAEGESKTISGITTLLANLSQDRPATISLLLSATAISQSVCVCVCMCVSEITRAPLQVKKCVRITNQSNEKTCFHWSIIIDTNSPTPRNANYTSMTCKLKENLQAWKDTSIMFLSVYGLVIRRELLICAARRIHTVYTCTLVSLRWLISSLLLTITHIQSEWPANSDNFQFPFVIKQ